MDIRNEIREFLTTRRARLTPADLDLPDYKGRRRVPGLRREEVALVAGMSVEYYVRLERGNATGVSESVLVGITRALKLDEAEVSHLRHLVRAANEGAEPSRRKSRPRSRSVRPGVQQLLDAMRDVPTVVQNGRMDVVAINALGRALFSPMYEDATRSANFARFLFLDPAAPAFYQQWEESAEQIVALLRSEAGRTPYDRELSDLVGELTTCSETFSKLWASHNVREHRTGIKSISHPVVGDLDLSFEALDLSGERGLQLVAFSAPPGSPTADGLQLLSNWAATNRELTQDSASDAS
ncbi:helix-turn-helix domain-containing protein [Nocardioides sp. KIGAM211]|uniref:Helix-turn-helix domain-containing protein n=1 Tax=Nocardioides luti TaxID=2761101 RepID=A0A7X0RKG1_9ACTN|nr:helix-turn-helix transcriptional regulator [Nocardioides luti]MBB6629807.1 helix-turn-helix domain-containing protein [Nocardioides luti]